MVNCSFFKCVFRHKWMVIPAAAIFLLSLSPVHALQVTDSLGRSVSFDRPPERIVLAGRGVLMVASALYLFPEASGRLVALEKIMQGKDAFFMVIDPNFGEKIILPTDAGPESILALRPDAVLMKSYMRKKLGKRLEDLGVRVLYFDFETPEQYERDLRLLGSLLGNESRADFLVNFYDERVGRIRSLSGELHGKPRVLLLYYSERGGSRTFNIPPVDWMQTLLVEHAGGTPVWADKHSGSGWTRVSFEQIAAWNADYIVVTSYFLEAEAVVERLYSDRLWQSLPVVRAKRLLYFPSDYFSWDQPDPRWILGLSWLAGVLHPDAFNSIDLEQEVRIFYRDLYNLHGAQYDRSVRPELSIPAYPSEKDLP